MAAPRCTGKKNDGTPCKGWRFPGSDKCRRHLPNPKARANATVRAEVFAWGFREEHGDPGEILLRLVTQSAARVEHYSQLLEEAYEAAERLKQAHEADGLLAKLDTSIETWEDENGRTHYESAAVQAAKLDLERIFNQGGVAALIGNTYSASNSGALYATGEAIRGLADLEAKERDRCATFAAKAVAAGLAERQVRLAERQGALIADVLKAVLGDPALGLTPAQREAAPAAIRRHLQIVAA